MLLSCGSMSELKRQQTLAKKKGLSTLTVDDWILGTTSATFGAAPKSATGGVCCLSQILNCYDKSDFSPPPASASRCKPPPHPPFTHQNAPRPGNPLRPPQCLNRRTSETIVATAG